VRTLAPRNSGRACRPNAGRVRVLIETGLQFLVAGGVHGFTVLFEEPDPGTD
jgi:hypothetical protein